MMLTTEAMNLGIASGSPALRVGFSSPIDKALKHAHLGLRSEGLWQPGQASGPEFPAIGVLREGRIDEIEHINIEVNSQWSARQVLEGFDGG